MRYHIALVCMMIVCSVTGAAGPAAAQVNDTLGAVLRYGVTLNTQGHSIPIDYQEGGTYSGKAAGVTFNGTWRTDGPATLCTASSLSPLETCTSYPPGMVRGDTFEVTSPTLGRVRITIRPPEQDQ